MSLKKCEQCGESVDEAKAFCPECGNPFVEEKEREESSEYENYAGTINFSKSVYKMMLSEMELDTSASTEKKEEPGPQAPKANKTVPQKDAKVQTKSKPNIYQNPAAPLSKSVESPQLVQENKPEILKWAAVAGIGLFILGILAVAAFLVGYFYFA